LDEASVLSLNAQAGGPPVFVVPLGVARWMRGKGIAAEQLVELDWWDEHDFKGLKIALTPAQHWSGRSLTDRLATLWGGFAVFGSDINWIYTGDTGYSRDFQDIAARYASRLGAGGFDLAVIPIGAYEPRWFMREQHINPAESVQIHLDLKSKLSIGVHWGTFVLTDEPLDQPPEDLARALKDKGLAASAFRALAVGETLKVPRR
jgi:N-acyl-phosphatidylethanolamine-hydrolysing phospholipase D